MASIEACGDPRGVLLRTLAERVGQRGAARRRTNRHRRPRFLLGMLLHDAPKLSRCAVVADARGLALERVGAHPLQHKALDRRGAHRAGNIQHTGGRGPEDFHATNMGIFAVEVVAQDAHLEHKHLNRLQRKRDVLFFRHVWVALVKDKVVPSLWLDKLAALAKTAYR